jgi:hypothetical protein
MMKGRGGMLEAGYWMLDTDRVSLSFCLLVAGNANSASDLLIH